MRPSPPTRFLLASAAAAAVTATALRPTDRYGPGASPAFAFGVPTSELPLHAGAAQAALLALLARGGGLRGVRGLLGLGLGAASAAGLWRLHRDAEASRPVLEEALVEGLGPGYRAAIGADYVPAPDVELTRRSVLMPDFRARRRYLAAGGRDLSYGDAGRRNHLDVWKRADLPDGARAPVLLQVHGGAWVMGQKQGQAHPLMAHLAERGWVCVTINYRLSPRATWPDQIVDVKRAIAWTKATIAGHGGDPGFLAITGGSAGGHLSSLAALTPNLAAYQPGFEDADTRVHAAVPFYGVYDLTDADGTGNRGLVPLLAQRVFKTSLDDDRAAWSWPRRSPTPAPRRRPSSSSTAPTTRWCRWRRRVSSSSACAPAPGSRWSTRSCLERSTPSTRSRRCGPTTRCTRSSGSSPWRARRAGRPAAPVTLRS